MLSRVIALCAFGIVLSAASLYAQPDVFVLPGAQSTSGLAEAFIANPAATTNPVTIFRTFETGLGAFTVLPNLAASSNLPQFFVVSSSTTNSILTTDQTFVNLATVANLPSQASQAVLTPDGKILAVAAGVVHLYSTATNAELIGGGVSQGIGFNTFAIASSLDSASIFALGSTAAGLSQLNSFGTSFPYPATGTLVLAQKPTALSVGPNGLVYVSLPNQFLEVDPRTLKTTQSGIIPVSGTPGPLVFTPDGQYGVAINQSSGSSSLLFLSLATHTASAPGIGVLEPTSVQVSGVGTLLALSSQGLYQVTISPLSVAPVAAAPSGIFAFATTNDVPTSTHSTVEAVYLLSSSATTPFTTASYDVSQYSPLSRVVSAPFPVAPNIAPTAITYVIPPVTTAQTNLGSLLTYGSNQTISLNATSEPLVVQLLDTNNVPLSGYTVQFQSSGGGATLSAPSAVTGSSGYALTYLTASSNTGTVTVTATAGTLTTTFSVNISSAPQTGATLSIVAGQGQLMLANTTTAGNSNGASSLTVLATNPNGNPIANLPITYTVPSGEGTLQVASAGAATQTVNTNSAGMASVDFLSTSVPVSDNDQGYLQTLVTASAASSNSVTFYVTTVNSEQTSVYFQAPQSGATVTGAEGSILPAGAKVQVVSAAGKGIPNVALTIKDNNSNPALLPSVLCNAPGGLVLTNAEGTASCDLTFGPRLGSGSFVEIVGATHISFPNPFIVTAGPPSSVQIVQGNNQTGAPGLRLPVALVVHITDSGGNVVTGSPVSWQVVTAGTVSLSNVVDVTDSNGNASALATLGSTGGAAQVTVTAGSASATFNLTIVIPTAGIKKVSGDQQITKINTAFASPLTVQVVDSNGNGLPGVQVNFQVTSGTATLGSSSAMTDSTGTASTTVMAGATAGPITVTATASSFTATFTLTSELPQPTNITVVNGASFDSNTGISPGGIATIRGMGILPGVTGLLVATANSSGDLPTTFSGVTITFNGTAAPIYYVQDTNGADQVSVQVPFEVQPGPAVSLTVTVANNGSTTVMVPVKPLAPGIFTSVYNGKTYAVAVRPDGSQVSPTNPARRGENIQLYVTGLGQATPTIVTGAPGVPNQPVVSPMVVGLNNSGVPLVSAVYGPGLIGVYVVILQVPADTQVGPYQPIGLIAVDSGNNNHYAQSTFIPIE